MSSSNQSIPQNAVSNTGPMVGAFSTSQIRYVEHMAFLEVISFFGEGVGAALYLLGFMADSFFIQIAGVVLVAVAVVALVLHLGSRAHLAWRALTKIRTSWVSRGSLFITLFMAFSVASITVHVVGSLAGVNTGALEEGLNWLAAVTAPLVIIYAGMMLRSMKAVTLWRTFYLPLGFSFHSIASALLLFLLAVNLLEIEAAFSHWLQPAILISLTVATLITLLHIFIVPRTAAIEASLERLIKNKFRARMLWGAGVGGILVPVGCLLIASLFSAESNQPVTVALLLLAVVARLFGDYAYRSAFVMSGAYEPIVPPASRCL